MTQKLCAIWGTPAEHLPGYERLDGHAFSSPRAGGDYFISRTAAAMLPSLDEKAKVMLSHEIVDQARFESVCEITSTTIHNAKQRNLPDAITRSQRLLRYLINGSEYVGQELAFERGPEQVLYAASSVQADIGAGLSTPGLLAHSDSTREAEVDFLLDILIEDRAIELRSTKTSFVVIVLPAGYALLESQARNPLSDQAFVAMWFNAETDEAYRMGIERAVREVGFEPMRIDQKEHINKIDDEIIAEIKRSRFLVADFTSERHKPRGGVYFEAGFAHALDIPVIWTCREDLIDQVHFDTRQFNHIVWSSPEELYEKLFNRIRAVIGEGPNRFAGSDS